MGRKNRRLRNSVLQLKTYTCNSTADTREEGFTLIEIILAIMLLAAGLSVILGLQSSAVDQTIRDRNKEFALLAGRRILSTIESGDGDIEILDKDEPMDKLLQSFGALDRNSKEEDLVRLAEFQGHIKVEKWGIPEVNPDAMKKILLDISWSPSPRDMVQLIYFVPATPPASTSYEDE